MKKMNVLQFFTLCFMMACAPTSIPQSSSKSSERTVPTANASDFDPTEGTTQYPAVIGSNADNTENATTNQDTGFANNLNDTGQSTATSEISVGHWIYTTGSETYNSCPAMNGSTTQPTESAGFQLQVPSTGNIVLTPDNSSDTITCQLQQNQYYCSPSSVDSSFSYEGLDVSIRTTTNLVIEANNSTNAVFYYSLLFSCVDVEIFGCGAAQDLPCNVEFYANAVWEQ